MGVQFDSSMLIIPLTYLVMFGAVGVSYSETLNWTKLSSCYFVVAIFWVLGGFDITGFLKDALCCMFNLPALNIFSCSSSSFSLCR